MSATPLAAARKRMSLDFRVGSHGLPTLTAPWSVHPLHSGLAVAKSHERYGRSGRSSFLPGCRVKWPSPWFDAPAKPRHYRSRPCVWLARSTWRPGSPATVHVLAGVSKATRPMAHQVDLAAFGANSTLNIYFMPPWRLSPVRPALWPACRDRANPRARRALPGPATDLEMPTRGCRHKFDPEGFAKNPKFLLRSIGGKSRKRLFCECNDLPNRRRGAICRPSFHQLAPLLE
jgi:hypothetical protein